MNTTFAQRLTRHAIPLMSVVCVASSGATEERRRHTTSTPRYLLEQHQAMVADKNDVRLRVIPPSFCSHHVTLMESAKAYEHNANDFDYYISHPTVEDLPVLLDRFDNQGQDVWPWIWTHPNEDGPHHVFIGKRINGDVVRRIQQLREESSQNNILILIQDDETSLEQAAASAGIDASVFAKCHCGIVTGVNLELLNTQHKILMLDDERVVAFDYLTIC